MSDPTRKRLELDGPEISLAEELELTEELEPQAEAVELAEALEPQAEAVELAEALEPHDDFSRFTDADLKQQRADAEERLARIRTRERALETGQKVILGAFLLAEARADPKIRAWLLKRAKARITREVDQKRLWPLLAELSKLPVPQPEPPAISRRPLPPSPPVTFDREPASESRPLPRRPPSDD